METKNDRVSGYKAEHRTAADNDERQDDREFLFTLLENIPAYIYLQARDYSIRYANRRFLEWFGDYGPKPCYKAIHGYDKPCQQCRTFEVFATNQPQEWLFYSPGGTIFRIYDYPFVSDNGEMLVMEMGIDVTDNQQYEDSRTRLFTDISHELRTPLAHISGYVEQLYDGLYSTPNERDMLLRHTYVNTRYLNELIEDLFELSRLESVGSLELKPVHLSAALRDFCEEQYFYLKTKQIDFYYEIGDIPLVMAESGRIIQVLMNLIENAVRYVPDGGWIRFEAKGYKGELLLTVSDNGRGIPKSEIKHIFSRFFRGNGALNKDQHHGIGLHICKTIVEQHNGKIWVDGGDMTGAIFFISIPAIGQV